MVVGLSHAGLSLAWWMVSLALEPVLMIAGRRDHSQASGRRQPSRGCFVGRGRDVARGSVGRAWAVGCGLWALGSWPLS